MGGEGATEDEMLDGITDSVDLSLGDGQGGLAGCGPRGRKEPDSLSD